MVGMSLAAVGVIMLIMALSKAAKANRFSAHSVPATGSVKSKERIRRSKNDSYRITAAYCVDGTEYTTRMAITHGDYINTSENDPIELLYLADDPEQAVRPRDINPRTIRLFLILGAAFLFIGAAAWFIGL